MGHEALVFLNDRAFLSSCHDDQHGDARSIEHRQVVVERRPRQRRRHHLEPSAANGWMTFAQLDPSAQAPWTSTTLTSFEDIAALLVRR